MAEEFIEETQARNNWPGWPGDNLFRMLIPKQKVGGIMGHKGELIKKMCEDSKAQMNIFGSVPGIPDRIILISAKEEPDLPIPPALDGLFQIHNRIIGAENPANAPLGGAICTRFIVGQDPADMLIEEEGAIIKSIQNDSHCTVRVLPGDILPVYALPNEYVVEIHGEPLSVHKAVQLLAAHLRKYLVHRSVVGAVEMLIQQSIDRAKQNMPPPQPRGPPPPGFPMIHGVQGYVSNLPVPFVAPPTTKSHSEEAILKATQNLQIHISYADAVIGDNGANISYIRRVSGANIFIQETKGVSDEMTVEISGSASQVQAANQLIRNSIEEAASEQNLGGAPLSQGYNPYAPPATVSAAPPFNAPGDRAGHEPNGYYGSLSQGYNPYAPPATVSAVPPSNAHGDRAGHVPNGYYGSVHSSHYGYTR